MLKTEDIIEPDVTVIMPCYNSSKYIRETLDSLLNQSYSDFFLMCIDDSSTDDTMAIIKEYASMDRRIVIIHNDNNGGIAYSRNKGLESAKTKYVAFVDHDDIMCKDRIKLCHDYLESHDETDIVAGGYVRLAPSGKELAGVGGIEYTDGQVRGQMIFKNIIPNGASMIRRELLVKSGVKFREKYGIEDYDFYTRLLQTGKTHILPEIVQKFRISEEQYTRKCDLDINLRERRNQCFDNVRKAYLLENGIALRNICEQRVLYLLRDDCCIRDLKNKLGYIFALGELEKKVKHIKTIDYNIVKNNTSVLKRRLFRSWGKDIFAFLHIV